MTSIAWGSELKHEVDSINCRRHRCQRIGILAILVALGQIMGVLSARAQLRDAIRQSYKVSEQLHSAQRKQLVGDYEAARAILLEALAEIPDSASLLEALGSVEQDLGKYLEAERAYLRALSVSGEAAANPERISILQNLGTLYLDTNQYSKGQRIRERLEELRPGVLDDHPTDAAKLLNVIGSLEHARNRDEEAERYYSRSLLLVRQAQGPASVDAALVQANMGFLLLENRQYGAAAFLYGQAIAEIEFVSGVQDPSLIRPLINLALCERMRHHTDEAEALARRAVELSTKTFGEAHVLTATAMLEQAETMRIRGNRELARDTEKRAKGYLRSNTTINSATFTIDVKDLGASRSQ